LIPQSSVLAPGGTGSEAVGVPHSQLLFTRLVRVLESTTGDDELLDNTCAIVSYRCDRPRCGVVQVEPWKSEGKTRTDINSFQRLSLIIAEILAPSWAESYESESFARAEPHKWTAPAP